MKVTKDMLSPYCKQVLEKYNVSIGQVSKLVPTLANKEKYVLHYRNVQLYLELGLKLRSRQYTEHWNLTRVHGLLNTLITTQRNECRLKKLLRRNFSN